MPEQTRKGDLTQMAKEIEKVIQKHVGLRQRPAMVVAFTCEPDWNDCHWISNVERTAAVMLLRDTAEKLIINSN